jgi:hypothetical protein
MDEMPEASTLRTSSANEDTDCGVTDMRARATAPSMARSRSRFLRSSGSVL